MLGQAPDGPAGFPAAVAPAVVLRRGQLGNFKGHKRPMGNTCWVPEGSLAGNFRARFSPDCWPKSHPGIPARSPGPAPHVNLHEKSAPQTKSKAKWSRTKTSRQTAFGSPEIYGSGLCVFCFLGAALRNLCLCWQDHWTVRLEYHFLRAGLGLITTSKRFGHRIATHDKKGPHQNHRGNMSTTSGGSCFSSTSP